MANPQKENGYVAIANELLEAIYSAKFTGGQLSILLYIIRRTYGFNKKKEQFTIRDISEHTGICTGGVSKSLNWMIENGIIIASEDDSNSRLLGINKNYEEWRSVHSSEHSVFTPVNKSVHSSEQKCSLQRTDTIKRQLKTKKDRHSDRFLSLFALYPVEKQEGLEWIPPECEAEILENEERVRAALEIYLNQTPAQYLVKAEKFFKEKWKLIDTGEHETGKKGRFE